MHTPYHIRPAAPDDHPALCEIDTMASHHPRRRDEIAEWISVDTCRLLEMDGRIAAYGVQSYRFFGEAFVEMLMVGSQFRRQGLGMALISNFRAGCTSSKLFSSTNMSNRPMQKLLIKAGFRPSGYIDNLDENDPEVVFFCRIP